MSSEIEVHPAIAFDCEQCGKETFVRLVVREYDTETLEHMRDDHGIEPWEAGEWVELPDVVMCHHCGQVFDVVNEAI